MSSSLVRQWKTHYDSKDRWLIFKSCAVTLHNRGLSPPPPNFQIYIKKIFFIAKVKISF